MKRKNRIRKSREFKEIIDKHKSSKDKSFIVYYQINNLGYPRIGISVSKKIGNAVVRNKTKRQINAMLLDIVKLDSSLDIVIIVRNEFLNSDYDTNKKSLSKLIGNLK